MSKRRGPLHRWTSSGRQELKPSRLRGLLGLMTHEIQFSLLALCILLYFTLDSIADSIDLNSALGYIYRLILTCSSLGKKAPEISSVVHGNMAYASVIDSRHLRLEIQNCNM